MDRHLRQRCISPTTPNTISPAVPSHTKPPIQVHYWQHGRIGHFIVESPMVLGHESSGLIHSVGPSVTHLKPGDRVCMEPGQPCRRCTRCKAGTYNLCPDMAFAATPPYDGTLCRYYKIPGDFCYKLPECMTLEEGALVEPLAVGVHITKQAGIRPGQSVVVFGAGPVGLLCLAVARSFGAGKCVAVDINEERLVFAKGYAATHAFRPSKEESPEQSAARLVEECGLGDGADAAIDASGAEVRSSHPFPTTRLTNLSHLDLHPNGHPRPAHRRHLRPRRHGQTRHHLSYHSYVH